MIHGSLHEREIYIYIRETAKHIYFSGRASKIGHENWWASMEETWQKKTWQESFMARNVRTP